MLIEKNYYDLKKEEIISLSDLLTLDEVQILYQIGLLAKRDMDLAPDIASGFEMALLRMLAFVPKDQDQWRNVKDKFQHFNKQPGKGD